MAYYWDSSHFKEAVGDWSLDRLFGIENGVPEAFGIKLTAENIDRALERIRADRAKYRREHPEDVAGIRAMVADVYRQVPPPLRVSIEGAE